MALVMLTEQRPYDAVARTLKRLSFVMLPLSVLFVRYYPEMGRGYKGDGSPMYTGIGNDKNALGLMCLLGGIVYVWYLLYSRTNKATRWQRAGDVVFIAVVAYLLRLSDSQTSTGCLIVSVGIMFLARVSWVARRPTRLVWMLLSVTLIGVVLESTLHVRDTVLVMMGRDPSLTNRTELWDVVRPLQVNAFVGTGFMSFWTGQRMQAVWDRMGSGINQAHNGYLEQYLNLGYVGVGFILLLILAALLNVRRVLKIQPAQGVLALCFLASAILYNFTEASFYGINNVWVLFLTSCIALPHLQKAEAIVATKAPVRVRDPRAFVPSGPPRVRPDMPGVAAVPHAPVGRRMARAGTRALKWR
jgi:O-antigen ligase